MWDIIGDAKIHCVLLFEDQYVSEKRILKFRYELNNSGRSVCVAQSKVPRTPASSGVDAGASAGSVHSTVDPGWISPLFVTFV